ncbi:MAG: ATP-binding protein [Phycisphaeraceae bacterium]|nr:ATP-binding protein [Phycisphaeraceae bacterium]
MSQGEHSTPASATIELVNDRDAIDAVEDRIVELAEHAGFSKSARFALRLALEEAIINAFKHGHSGLPPDTTITVDYEVGPSRIFVAVEDQGPGFVPDAVPDPTLDENLELPSGRGLVLIRAYMTSVTYNERGNRVELVLERKA